MRLGLAPVDKVSLEMEGEAAGEVPSEENTKTSPTKDNIRSFATRSLLPFLLGGEKHGVDVRMAHTLGSAAGSRPDGCVE
jgi:hypothetical protein